MSDFKQPKQESTEVSEAEQLLIKKRQFTTHLRAVNDIYNARLKLIMSGDNKDFRPLELGRPSDTLLSCGFPDLPIQMAVQRLVDKKLQKNHPFSLVSVTHLPDYLAFPIAVFQSKTRGDSKVVFTGMQDKCVNIIVAVELNRMNGAIDVNSVRSVYPKDNIKDVLLWINDGLLEYVDKEKALDWMGKQQSNSADVTRLVESSTKVINSFIN